MVFKLKEVVPTEKQEHLAFMDWVRLNPLINGYLIHTANEYDGGIIGGYQRRLMGVKKGVSDFFMALPTKCHHGLWIELKRRFGSKVSVEQQDWINKMVEKGYKAKVCYGCDDAIKTVLDYLNEN